MDYITSEDPCLGRQTIEAFLSLDQNTSKPAGLGEGPELKIHLIQGAPGKFTVPTHLIKV